MRHVESYISAGWDKLAKKASVSQSDSTRAIYFNSILIVVTYIDYDSRSIPLSRMATLLILNEYMVTNAEGFEGLTMQV